MNRLLFLLLFVAALTGPFVPAAGQSVTDEQLGLQYFSNREFDKAAAVFEQIFEEKQSVYSYTYLLQSLLELNQLDKAEKIVRKQARKYPDDPRYIIDQGYVLIRENQSNKAYKIYDQAIKDLPADQRRVIELANAFQVRRENEYAIKTYLRGRQMLAPEYTFGYELAMIYEVQGNYEKMADEYLDLLTEQPEMQNQVQARLQNSLNNDPEGEKSEALRSVLLKKVQKSPDDVMLAEMMLWLSVQLKDFESAFVQARALDRRNNENGTRMFSLAQLCASNTDYATAAKAFTYVIEKSTDASLVVQARVELLKAEYELLTNAYPVDHLALIRLEEKYKKTLGEAGNNPFVYPLMQNLAHLEAFYLNDSGSAIALLEQLIGLTGNDPQFQAGCKLELGDIMLFTGDPWEATLLYSQVDKAFKNDPIGHEARFRNARLSFYIGEFNWALAQLDVLKAATSKLIANDAMALSLLISDNIEDDSSTVQLATYARADLLFYRNMPDSALSVLDSLMQAFPGHSITDDALMLKAEILSREGRFDDATAIYLRVDKDFGDGILGDDALYNLARLYDRQLNDKTKAMAAYQELLVKYPGSLFTVEARKRFRELRGDQVN